MEIIKTAVDFVSLWINVGIVMAGGGQELKVYTVKPCKYSKIPECRVLVEQTKIEIITPE